MFIKEWRIPVQQYVVGFPAGLVGDINSGEDVSIAASRELEEETGWSAERMRLVTSGPPSAGLSDETIHFYIADQMKKVGEGGGDDSEDISVHTVKLSDAHNWLNKQAEEEDTVVGPKSYIGLYWVKLMMESIE